MNESLLVNLRRIMVFLRSDIRNKENDKVLNILIKAYEGIIYNNEMCDMIIKIMPDWKEQLMYGEGKNQLIQEEIIKYVKTAMQIMKDSLSTGEYDMAYDIADLLHVLPDVIMQDDKSMKKYWKVFVKKFDRKWKCNAFTKYKKYFV